MTPPRFVHLHLHTHYSLLDGATRIEALMDRAKSLDMPAVAMTDHGNLFGAVEFYTAAHKAGIKPILGCEAYLTDRDRRMKEAREGKEAFHLLLLATNNEGYRNLLKLSSIGYTEGFYRKPRIDKAVLREFSAGLLCTSTCIGGEVPQAFLTRDGRVAEDLAKSYLEIFGPDRFFIELQDHGMSEQKTLNPELVDLAKRLGVGLIATNDVHYLDHGDVEAHDVLCCINTGKLVSDEERFRFPTDQFYFKTAEEMASLFPDRPEALANTLRVADMCNVELDLKSRHAPVFRVPDDIRDDDGQSLDDGAYLRKLVYEGARERYGDINDELRERIEYELDVIISKGFASYFLIVWDVVNYAREHGIPVGARGSGCSAVVAHCLYISAPDPIRYELYFERFMDPDRDEMPDIDLDICQNGRARIIDYVRNKYGHVAQIITFNTLKAKAVIKDVARVLGLNFNEANEITALVPVELKMTLDKALSQEPELRKRYESDERVRRIIDIGRKLEGVARNAGVHAAGVVVADQPLDNFLPLYRQAGHEALITQFDGPSVERVGLLKMDFLGLRTLTTLERARQLAERSSGKNIDLTHVDLTDQRVYELIARGDTRGIFQFESGGMREVIMRMKPNRIEDLIAANALYRPGPMEYIPDYIARKHGAAWNTPHPIMTEVLTETYGIMVYQEQVSRVVNRLGGIELKAAFRLAKAISKKKTDMIEAMREPFLEGCVANGVRREVANQVFDDILKFGGYAFNKAHSTGYALVAYQTAWMKTYFPVEFMAALITFEMGSTEKVAEYCGECREIGITVEPPNVNRSEYEFVVSVERESEAGANGNPGKSRRSIQFGLGAIKGVGAKAVGAIVDERERGGAFRSLFDFCERVDLSAVNRGAVEALICAGAFDETGAMRKALMDALERAIAGGQRAQRDRRSGQLGLFGFGESSPAVAVEPALSAAEWNEAEMLAHEKEVLGFYITKHPLASHELLLRACTTASTTDLVRFQDGMEVTLGGMVTAFRTVTTRGGRNAGRQMGIVSLEDLAGKVEGIIFSSDMAEQRAALVPDALVFVTGQVDRRREEPSIRISKVISQDEAMETFGRALILTLAAGHDLDALVGLLRESRGEAAVYLNCQTEDDLVAQLECHASLRVRCHTELLSRLMQILGRDAVTVLGPTRRPIPLPLETVFA
ncbi:MAG: DNA polymerase III subunit alpha [Phycisphaerae bacterium]|nr:DNA polymerase III subunit alpha [Phycisphaerae bacterium]